MISVLEEMGVPRKSDVTPEMYYITLLSHEKKIKSPIYLSLLPQIKKRKKCSHSQQAIRQPPTTS